MKTNQRALRLADLLETEGLDPGSSVRMQAADELRNLHDLLGKANALLRIRFDKINRLETEISELNLDVLYLKMLTTEFSKVNKELQTDSERWNYVMNNVLEANPKSFQAAVDESIAALKENNPEF